ncbi:lipopolysaccharide biosynthesis protein [Priestia megaterium]|uniref:lipopolysaccharide biosynthesis protein n=1 Tax=Priestia megaterium TaxID=1404 RepID=UPI002FFDA574
MLIDILSKLIGLIVCITFGKDLIIGKVTSLKISLTEIYSNMSVGLKLMLANISSMLILGIGRYVIDYVWGVTVFGELALMLSIVSMFLLFINATSIALFPALRRISVEELPKTYVSIRNILMGLLLSILILYVPAKILLNIWFPEYQDSIKYLSILLPLCIFDGKMQMLVSTYLKVIRKENSLLTINIICVLLSALLCISTAIIFKNLTGVIISMVMSVFIRSIIAEVYLALQLKVSLIRSVFYETLLILTFSITSWYLIDTINIIIYLIFYLIFLVSIRKEASLLSGIIKNVKSAK